MFRADKSRKVNGQSTTYQQVLKLCCLEKLRHFYLLAQRHDLATPTLPHGNAPESCFFLSWELIDDAWINRNHEVRPLTSIHLVATYICVYIYIIYICIYIYSTILNIIYNMYTPPENKIDTKNCHSRPVTFSKS